jgi:hypothetical protein
LRFSLQLFTDFTSCIPLEEYRQKYAPIKIVEMDLPREIQALKTIYEQYWENKDNLAKPLDFDEYYKVYLKDTEGKRQDFRDKSRFGNDCSCFDRGLEARIYRTWAALITQIHAGYVAESVFDIGAVQMSSELDHNGIDFLITKKNKEQLKIQVKKVSHRLESRITRKLEKDLHIIEYSVPIGERFYKVGKNKGKPKPQFLIFEEFDPNNGILRRYDNGFIVFTPKVFEIFV